MIKIDRSSAIRSTFGLVFFSILTILAFTVHGDPQRPSGMDWLPRGSYFGLEFTSLQAPPGFACIIIFTTLQNGGLKVSTDCGLQYADLLFTNAYSVTAKSENIAFVASGTAGVIKTVSQGTTWFPVNDGLPLGADARSITIDLAPPDTLFCGFYGDGVYKGSPAQDSLVSWTPMNNGLGDFRVRTLSRVRGGTYFLAATESGIWRYENGIWNLVGGGLIANSFMIDSADSARVYAATEDGVYKSVDAGLSFSKASVGLPDGMAANDIVRRTDVTNVLYVGMRGAGVYQSIDFGEHWAVFGPPLPGDNDVRAVLATVETDDNLVHVFAGTRADGLYESQMSSQTQSTTWGRLKNNYR